ncbi:MAG TPA: filamentous hemagglutinin N-terminal domain-containing protein, partial [Marinagarivorans sp.]
MAKFYLKSAGTNPLLRAKCARPWVLMTAILSAPSYALPEGGQVVAGDARIDNAGDAMNIQQDSQRVIIDFESYNIAGHETVNYNQPNSDAVALNRVLGSDLSAIDGTINANGQVYLINPNGVLFGDGAQVNVGGLVATSLDTDNQAFLDGREHFTGDTQGTVANRGQINARDRVVLMAPQVSNSGEINVPGGDIMLRSGRDVLLHSPGSEIPILVEDAELNGQVVNTGTLNAGSVALVMDGKNGREVYDNAINNYGLVRAVAINGEGGKVQLLAPNADVVQAGTINASADQGRGGEVDIRAERYGQTGDISASGRSSLSPENAQAQADGGDVNILASEMIALTDDSRIAADAGTDGDGGDIILYAEHDTWFNSDSRISARGGTVAGDGGFVEVSGQEFVSVAGQVDVGAPQGEGGLWFIDPTDVTISANADLNSTFSGGNPATWAPTNNNASAQISSVTLRNTLLNNGSVLIATASGGSGAGDITFDTTLDYDGVGAGGGLTLQADNAIIFTANGVIRDSNSASADSLNFVANANNGFTMDDAARISVGAGSINISAASGDVKITGLVSTSTANNTVQVNAVAGAVTGSDIEQKDIDVGDGGLLVHALNAIGELSIESNFVDIVSTTGDVTIHEEGSTSVLRLESPETVNFTTGLQFSVDLATVFNVNNLNVDAGTDFRIADAGVTVSGNLSVVANTIRGNAGTVASGTAGTPVIMSAANADITLRDGSLARHWSTSFDQLALSVSGGASTFTLVDTNALVLSSIALEGEGSFTSNGDLAISSNPNVGGPLALNTITSGDVIIPAAGLNHAGTLTINADNLSDGDNDLTLAATDATLNLRDGSAAQTWNTSFDQLTATIAGTGDLTVVDSNALTIAGLNTGGAASVSATAGDLTLTAAPAVGGDLVLNTIASGDVIIPAAGLNHAGALTINADNLSDGDNDLTLAATDAMITLRNASANHLWNTAFDSLAANIAGGAGLTVTDSNALVLA